MTSLLDRLLDRLVDALETPLWTAHIGRTMGDDVSDPEAQP